MTKGILERLAEGPVLGDGGYLLELEKRGYVQAGPFTPEMVLEHPDALAQLHREFLRAGVDVLQTMTFYASEDKLATVGMQGKVDDINRTAVQVAREVASEGDALVAGNLSLTWAYDPADAASPDHVRALFDRQLQDQLDAGPPDFWIGETFCYLGEALLFVERAKRDRAARHGDDVLRAAGPASYEGDTPGDCARRLADAGADIVGVNCLNGPEQQLRSRTRCGGGRAATSPRSRSPTGRPPSMPDFTAFDAFPYELDPMQLSRQRWPTFAARGQRSGHRLHRLVLRERPGARPGDGQGPREAPGSRARVEGPSGRPMSATSTTRTPRPRCEAAGARPRDGGWRGRTPCGRRRRRLPT